MNAHAPADHAASPGIGAAPSRGPGARTVLAEWRGAIGSLTSVQWKWAALIALFGATLQCALMLGELAPKRPLSSLATFSVWAAICWSVQVSLGLSAWAIADRPCTVADRRPRRLAVALLTAVLLQAVIAPPLSALLVGPLDPCLVHGCEGKDWSKVPSWLMHTSECGRMLILGALIFAWLEMRRRNREVEERLIASQQERSRLQRRAIDARLTAMRAQVDPQFLFDSLADVQSVYAVDNARGGATLDLLIAYLRTALPRLRLEGSTIGAETELVGAWLEVVRARRHGRPSWQIEVDPDCVRAPLTATVLLPLVQWAVGGPADAADAVALHVRRRTPDAGALRATLRVQPGRPCAPDDAAPRRIRERLQAMYGDDAQLSCTYLPATARGNAAGADGMVITLQWPDESADRDRR